MRDLISKEQKYIEQVEFIIDEEKFNLPLYQFIKYSQIQDNNDNVKNIVNELTYKLNKCVKAKRIEKRNISIFFSLLSENNVNFTSDSLIDLFLLSKIFKNAILESYLKEYTRAHSKDVDLLINLLYEYEMRQNRYNRRNNSNNNDDNEYDIGHFGFDDEIENEFFDSNDMKSIIEQELKDKINECVKREKFGKLKISTICRIIEKSNFERNNQDLIYEFIRQDKETRFILLQFIEFHRLSSSEIEVIYSDYSESEYNMKKHYEEYLRFDFIYYQEKNNQERSLKERNSELEKKLKQIQEINDEISKNNEKYFQKNKILEKKNEEYQTQILNIEERNKKLQKSNEELIMNNKKYQERIDELEKRLKEIVKQNDEIKKNNENNQKRIKEYEEIIQQIRTDNEQLTKMNSQYKTKFKELEQSLTSKECKYEGNEFDGIFSLLKKKYGEKLIKDGIIKLSDAGLSSGHGLNDIINDNTVEYHTQGSFTTNKSDGWFEIDFVKGKINLTSYSLKTASDSIYSYPKSWRIVGSNDKINWTILNHQTNITSLNGQDKHQRFECEENHQYYQYIRFIQEDSWDSRFKYNIVLTQIELFGSIISSS